MNTHTGAATPRASGGDREPAVSWPAPDCCSDPRRQNYPHGWDGRPAARSGPKTPTIRAIARGVLAIGEVEDDDWEQTVEPVLRREIAEGRKVRLLYLLGAEAREVERDAMAADTGFRARHATSFERVAVVSDEDWIRPAVRALSFLLPGKARGFRVHELEAVKSWLAEGLEN